MTAEEIDLFIRSNEWTFAKSMPQNPHWYVVRGKCWDKDSFDAFVIHIREHGYALEFGGREYVYFDVRDFKYWTMGAPLETTVIINRAKKP